MNPNKWGVRLSIAALLLMGTLACDASDLFLAMATATPTRTPRPTFTLIPTSTNTPLPTITATRAPTTTPTKTATLRPTLRPTPKPATATPKPAGPPPPTVSTMEFHVSPPTCTHSGLTYLKGTVYLDKNDPSQRYYRAIVALGPPDGSTIYATVLTDGMGEYTFVLGDTGKAVPGNWGLWLVTPSMVRKSDIGGPINTNNLGPDNSSACWAGGVDFWK